MKIEVTKPSKKELEEKNIFSWPIWEKEVSRFNWYYDSTEECYFLSGKVTVKTKDGEEVEINKGDFVRFPKGLSCEWIVKQPVKKHYNFK
jgi:uncharacterized cupin superfamily protein